VLGLDDQAAKNGTQTSVTASAADTAILQGKLAAVVHKAAVAKLPQAADMRLSMLRATHEVAIEASSDLQSTIVSSFVQDLGSVRFWSSLFIWCVNP
jgi:hypothetical protein